MSIKGYKKPKNGEFILRDGWTLPSKPCKRGHMAPRTTNGSCAQCLKDYRKANNHFSQNEKTIAWRKANREKLNAARVEYNKNNLEQTMLNSCKRVAKQKNLPFNLSIDDILIPKICPILGLELVSKYGIRSDSSPSIDRIIPEIGYVKGNIIIISMRANRIKNDATIEELMKISNFYKALVEQ